MYPILFMNESPMFENKLDQIGQDSHDLCAVTLLVNFYSSDIKLNFDKTNISLIEKKSINKCQILYNQGRADGWFLAAQLYLT